MFLREVQPALIGGRRSWRIAVRATGCRLPRLRPSGGARCRGAARTRLQRLYRSAEPPTGTPGTEGTRSLCTARFVRRLLAQAQGRKRNGPPMRVIRRSGFHQGFERCHTQSPTWMTSALIAAHRRDRRSPWRELERWASAMTSRPCSMSSRSPVETRVDRRPVGVAWPAMRGGQPFRGADGPRMTDPIAGDELDGAGTDSLPRRQPVRDRPISGSNESRDGSAGQFAQRAGALQSGWLLAS